MSKLDNIILECANKVLDGKEEKLGDYIDPTKEQIKDLFLELIEELSPDAIDPTCHRLLINEARKKVKNL